jgi:hypothetical protein
MTTDTVDYRFRHCQAKPKAEAARVQSEYGQTNWTERERQIYWALGYLDPRLADEDVARKKIAPRAAEDYKRKGG